MSVKKICFFIFTVVIVVWIIALLTKKETTYVTWNEAIHLFEGCKVSTASQSPSLDVILGLKDGSTIFTKAISITALGEITSKLQPNCGHIQVSVSGY